MRDGKRLIRTAFVEARHDSLYGAQQSLFTLVSNLSGTEIMPIVVTTGEGLLTEKYRDAGVDVVVIPLHPYANKFGGEVLRYSTAKKIRVALEILKYNLRFARWIRKARIDVVYANDLRGLFYVALGGKLAGKPLLWYIRGEIKDSLMTRIGLHFADRIILIAEGVCREGSIGQLSKYRDKSTVLYTGFDLGFADIEDAIVKSLKQKLRIPENAHIIGEVASIVPNKGHDLLIRAVRRIVSDYDCYLVFLGDSPPGYEDYREQLEKTIESLGLTSRVHWLGFHEDLALFYGLMDVLVLPSHSEGLPRVVIEGLSAGLPVVATDVGGVSEILLSNVLGRVVPPNDVDRLTQAISDVIRDCDMNNQSARETRIEYVKERFSIDAYVRGFESIVLEVVKS